MTDEHTPEVAEALAEAAGLVSGRADELAKQIGLLRTELAEARTQATEDIKKAQAAAEATAAADLAAERADRRLASWKFAGIVLADVALSVVGLGLYFNQLSINHRLETSLKQNYTTSQQQAVTRTRVLCPLYEVLLAAAANPAPQATATPEQKARLEKAVKTIRDGYTTLGCTPPLSSG